MSRGRRYGVSRGEPNKDLNNEGGWPLRNSDILKLFGLKENGPIPIDFRMAKRIGNVWVHIFPRGSNPRGIKRRVVAECPKCQEFICAGHLNQHFRSHVRD
jgi:hypothetical protein